MSESVHYFYKDGWCSNDKIDLATEREITIKSSNSLVRDNGRECSITIQSETGFDIDVRKADIRNCGVTFTMHAGSSKHYRAFVSKLHLS